MKSMKFWGAAPLDELTGFQRMQVEIESQTEADWTAFFFECHDIVASWNNGLRCEACEALLPEVGEDMHIVFQEKQNWVLGVEERSYGIYGIVVRWKQQYFKKIYSFLLLN